MVQAVEHLPTKHEALSLNPSIAKKKIGRKKEISHLDLAP
jgi:hypothetical protein